MIAAGGLALGLALIGATLLVRDTRLALGLVLLALVIMVGALVLVL